MIITILSECEKKAYVRARRILSRYLPQLGRRTWCGHISAEGLKALHGELRRQATRQSALICHTHRRRRPPEVAWRIGSPGAYGEDGTYAHTYRKLPPTATHSPDPYIAIYNRLVELAGLLHDIGKGTIGFQDKLARSVAPAREVPAHTPDTLRHELVSLLLLAPLCQTDEPFQRLLSPEAVAEYFASHAAPALAAAREALEPWRLQAIAYSTQPDDVAPDERAPRPRAPRSAPCSVLKASDWAARPVTSALLWLVLTHHRLPGGQVEVVETRAGRRGRATAIGEQINCTIDTYMSAESAGRLDDFLTLAPGEQPWQSARWCTRVARCAASLARAIGELAAPPVVQPDAPSDWVAGLAFLARPALIYGDYQASAEARPDEAPGRERAVYAKTVPQEAGASRVFGDRLETHLLDVGARASATFRGLCALTDSPYQRFPTLSRAARPLALDTLRPDRKSPFYWQRAAREALKPLPTGAGLFAVLLAGTGSGKTIAAAHLLSSISDQMRVSVALGLRTLTTQTYEAYVGERMGFARKDVALLIGGSAGADAPGHDSPHGTDNEASAPLDAEDAVVLAEGDVLIDTDAYSPLLSMIGAPKERALFERPISILTIDHLVCAASLARGGDTRVLLHLMHADLVIDEIDEFTAEDLVTIGRLVHLCALYGRRVLIASATAAPAIVEGLYAAYMAGQALRRQWWPQTPEPQVAFIANHAPFARLVAPPADIRAAYRDFASGVAAALASAPVRHRRALFGAPRLAEPRDEALGISVDALLDGCADLHSRPGCHVVDEESGVRCSAGFIRFSRVADAQRFAALASRAAAPRGMDFRLLCYHAQHTLLDRMTMEGFLNAALRREHGAGERDPLLGDRHVRTALNAVREAGGSDLLLIVVTSPIIETGRDHDYDWAVLEPCSTRSMIQAVGRVWRHRREKTAGELANVLVLDAPLRAARGKDRPWSYPGIETRALNDRSGRQPPHYPVCSQPAVHLREGLLEDGVAPPPAGEVLALTGAAEAFGELLETPGCHAAPALLRPERYAASPISALEHLALGDRLIRAASRTWPGRAPGLPAAIGRADCLLNDHLHRALPFRGRQAQPARLFFTAMGADYNTGSARLLRRGVEASVAVSDYSRLDEARFLLRTHAEESYASLAERLGLDPDRRTTRRALCGVDLPRHRQGIVLAFNPLLGFVA
ncbi:hypothetical protein J2T57_001737 [Natronocella acetinitrilica]|uniref:HD Cas3-type domain-containing protein n=1 Tax=Natronocella acetinitrilica TaxID=414046 RepID=A0AAE3G2I7_9GAMM|nr:HD domain-containing protein [Natronocella acetinitrilica]MCP1674635.1 hypothetical protein [Natronocella acetinitrilica]